MPTLTHPPTTAGGATVSVKTSGNGVESAGNYRRTYSDIRALDRALVLDDLPSARQAFARLMEDSPRIANAVSHDPFPINTRPVRALKVLGRCLLTGNLRMAKQAFQRFHLVPNP